jgi:hypothetical protein
MLKLRRSIAATLLLGYGALGGGAIGVLAAEARRVLADMAFPGAHQVQLRSTNPLSACTPRSNDVPTWSTSSPTSAPSFASSAL